MKTLAGRTEAKAVCHDECDDQGRRPEDRNRLDTVLVLAVNDADGTTRIVLCKRN